ncbi:MAG: hypothetical protein WBA57_17855 [Elainellaceae cyanobacterium]
MSQQNLAEISAKLVKVIRTRDASRVRTISDKLDRQRNSVMAMELFAMIDRTLGNTDKELQHWFHEVYFEGCPTDFRDLWLDFAGQALTSQSAI